MKSKIINEFGEYCFICDKCCGEVGEFDTYCNVFGVMYLAGFSINNLTVMGMSLGSVVASCLAEELNNVSRARKVMVPGDFHMIFFHDIHIIILLHK